MIVSVVMCNTDGACRHFPGYFGIFVVLSTSNDRWSCNLWCGWCMLTFSLIVHQM